MAGLDEKGCYTIGSHKKEGVAWAKGVEKGDQPLGKVVCCLHPTTYNPKFNIGLANATVPLRRKSIGQVTKQTSHFLYNDKKR